MTTAPTTQQEAVPAAAAARAGAEQHGALAGTGAGAGTRMVQLRLADGWFSVCEPARLTAGRGVAALLPDGRQVAVFLDRAGRCHAIDNVDPFTGAAVLSRGLLGSAAGTPFVASPLLKQRFVLTDGRCLDDADVSVATYEVRVGAGAPAPAG